MEARLTAIENALALPHTAQAEGGAAAAELQGRIRELEAQLARANYRILHLVKSLEETKESGVRK